VSESFKSKASISTLWSSGLPLVTHMVCRASDAEIDRNSSSKIIIPLSHSAGTNPKCKWACSRTLLTKQCKYPKTK